MGECHNYNKRMNIPAFRELRLMPTQIVLNDTKVEIEPTIKTKRVIEMIQTMETKGTKCTMQTFSHAGRNANG